MAQSKNYIYGKHAITEALTNAPHSVLRVHFSKEMKDSKLRELARKAGVPTEPFDERKVTSWVERNAPHQGAIALVSMGSLMIPFEKWLKPQNQVREQKSGRPEGEEIRGLLREKLGSKAVILLHEIQDPHNVGTIIRSAAAFGAEAVLMPQAKQSPITGAVIKSSAGMAFSIPLVSVPNLQKTISEMKKAGYRVYGLAGEGKKSIVDESFPAKSLFIMGNESQGLPKSTVELCDALISIPIDSRAESLNVAAAAAVTLYQWRTKHQ